MTTELEQLVDALLASDLSNRSIDELIEQLRPHTEGQSISAPTFPSGMLLFRRRVVKSASTIQELSYPPAHLTQIGRLNRAGQPLFYASSSRSAVFFETAIETATPLLISRWRTKAPMLLTHIGYHTNTFELLGSKRTVAGWDGKTSPHASAPESEKTWYGYSRLFSQRVPISHEFRYKLSVAAAECMLGSMMAGILYPSISMWANADNIALRPEWVDVNLRFVGVEKIRIDAVEGKQISFTTVDYATSPDGVFLEWKGRGPNIVLRKQGETVDFKSTGEIWQAFDETGQAVDPE